MINEQHDGVIWDVTEQCFTNGNIISYRGENYYRACDYTVLCGIDGNTHCVKRVNHPGNEHEDYYGSIAVSVG